MNNNIVIGVAVVVVLIVVLGFVLGNQGENYSIFPEYATPAGVQGVDWDYAAPTQYSTSLPSGVKAATSPMMAATVAKAINPPATPNTCKSLLKAVHLNVPGAPDAHAGGAADFAKSLLSSPAATMSPNVIINSKQLKRLMASLIFEASQSGMMLGFAATAKAGAVVTKQQMNQLKVKAGKTRDRDLMSFAERADKLADTLSDISSKFVSTAKPVCYSPPQGGNKYPIYKTMNITPAAGVAMQKSIEKILSDMNNGGNPFFFMKNMEELRNILESKKC
tara:strand:+ start:649 stop:1482 length:834 start_codon:yes stop_codon:yes gene_type:complete